jgi:biotin synthesis protein BioG
MDFRWLQREHETEVLVVFGGWAVGSHVFDHLTGDYDVLFASDYRDLNADLPDLSGYESVNLVAWSFGVASYAHWQQGRPDPFDRKVAVNGTLHPVNRATGLPPVAMSKTIETLSEDAYQVFLARVFNARQPIAEIDVSPRQAELRAIEARGDAPMMPFDRVWISTADKIFPPANQIRAWPENTIRQIAAPHAPFAAFATWQEIMS